MAGLFLALIIVGNVHALLQVLGKSHVLLQKPEALKLCQLPHGTFQNFS